MTLRGITGCILLGVAVGVATQRAADILPSIGYAISTFTGPWVVVGALVARRAKNLQEAIVAVTSYFLAATIAYYATFYAVKTHVPLRLAVGWFLVSLVAGPAVGWLGHSTTTERYSSLASGTLAGWLLGEAAFAALLMKNPNRWTLVLLNAAAAGAWLSTSRGPRRSSLAMAGLLTLPSVVMIGGRFLIAGRLL